MCEEKYRTEAIGTEGTVSATGQDDGECGYRAMEFSYQELGAALARIRTQKGLTQRELEERSRSRLKQAAISEAENGNKRLPLDRFVEFCNLLEIRSDEVLDPYLSSPPMSDQSDAIVDSYVIAMAELMQDCPPNVKEGMIEICQCMKNHFLMYEKRHAELKNYCETLEDQIARE